MSVTDYREIVAALRDVPGVADADVEPDADVAEIARPSGTESVG